MWRIPPTRSMRFLVTALVATLVLLLLVSSGASLWARVRVANTQSALDHRWLRVQAATLSLESAYVDQETGERGFLLTGNSTFLEPYTKSQPKVRELEARLRKLLEPDRQGTALLEGVISAHTTWLRQSAEPEIAARRVGPIPQPQLDAAARTGKQRFDDLRAQLLLLSDRTDVLVSDSLQSFTSAQVLADVVAAVTVALAVLAALIAFPIARRLLTRPLDHLLGQLGTVAGGDYGQAIEPQGATELQAMAESAEQMRRSLLRHSRDLVAAQRALTLQSERDRLAADLHDRSIQRLFALGLSLSALAKRHPEAAPRILPLIEDTDAGIRELRAVIFDLTHDEGTNLRLGIDQVLQDASHVLGFLPDLELRGPVTQVVDEKLTQEVLAALREALGNVARHARASRVEVLATAEGDWLRLEVSDDGAGPSSTPSGHDLRDMEARAAGLGGSVALHRRPEGGTTLEWRVPLPA